MLIALSRFFPNSYAWKGVKYIFPGALLIIGVYTLHDYLSGVMTVLLAGYAAIATTAVRKPQANKQRFAIAALVMLTLTWLVPVKTLLYFAGSFALFFWIEMHYASIHALGVVALFLSSPAFHYTAAVFSFPIRLQLAKMAGTFFSVFSSGVELKGNIINYHGREFAVDPACAGLHMLSISMLLGIVLVGLLQKKAGKIIGWKAALFYLVLLFILNIFANVVRIILLVQFAVPPEAFLHDAIGLLCLLLYVCVPACYLAKFFLAKSSVKTEQEEIIRSRNSNVPTQWLLLIGLLFLSARVINIDTYSRFNSKYQHPAAGYATSVYGPGIIKLENEKALVYIKYIRGFYDTEHNPAFCWQGSGYEFKEIQLRNIEGSKIYTAVLRKGDEKLHTAWWYGNKTFSTTSQWEWRWSMIKTGNDYGLINVTAADEGTLITEVKSIMLQKTLQPFFNKP